MHSQTKLIYVLVILLFSDIVSADPTTGECGDESYYRARHGIGYEDDDIVFVSKKLLENASTIDEIAIIVKNNYNCSIIGFTIHPGYPAYRLVGAVISYVRSCAAGGQLYLWDEKEANKGPYAFFCGGMYVCFGRALWFACTNHNGSLP